MTSPADTEAFVAKKKAQWERISSAQPGLQLVRYGKLKATFMLVKSVEGFYEGVVIGQVDNEKRVAAQAGRRVHYRKAREDEKPVERRAVDLGDAQIDQVLAQWAAGQSAVSLPFVGNVWDETGEMIV